MASSSPQPTESTTSQPPKRKSADVGWEFGYLADEAHDQAKRLTIFIYAHHKTLALMRHFTKKRDIVRPGVTRFASAFLTLQSLAKKKAQLRQMFTSDEWEKCKFSKTVKGKAAYASVVASSFWN
ncbi:hypothetical protein Tco_0160174, partial [Tanacetum coccineum]